MIGPHMRKRLVVDACVLRAAGTTENPTSSASRSVLEAILSICHRVLVTPAIETEWEEHESNVARAWRARMLRRGKFVTADVASSDDLEAAITSGLVLETERREALKDVHLLVAARAGDHAIISLDANARRLFERVPGALEGVVWVDPLKTTETRAWLEAGARAEDWTH